MKWVWRTRNDFKTYEEILKCICFRFSFPSVNIYFWILGALFLTPHEFLGLLDGLCHLWSFFQNWLSHQKNLEDGQKITLMVWRHVTECAGDKIQSCVLESKLYNSVTKNHIAYGVAGTLVSTHRWTGRCNRCWCLESERGRRSSHEP